MIIIIQIIFIFVLNYFKSLLKRLLLTLIICASNDCIISQWNELFKKIERHFVLLWCWENLLCIEQRFSITFKKKKHLQSLSSKKIIIQEVISIHVVAEMILSWCCCCIDLFGPKILPCLKHMKTLDYKNLIFKSKSNKFLLKNFN